MKWYLFFFINQHVDFTFENIRKSKQKMEEIIEKVGQEWYDTHVKDYRINGKTSF